MSLLLFIFAKRRLVFEDNIIESLQNTNSTYAKVFKNFQKNSFFENKLFVDYGKSLTQNEIEKIDSKIQSYGYKPSSFFSLPPDETINEFIVFLPQNTLENLLSQQSLLERSKQAFHFATLPGSNSYFNYLQKDPLGLQAAIFTQFSSLFSQTKQNSLQNPNNLKIYIRSKPLVYEKFGGLYRYLTSQNLNIKIIGGDLFSYENYVAIKKDIHFCMLFSLPLNLFLFFIFVRRFKYLVFLIAGSLISYITGLFFVSVFYVQLYAVVIAFTSAFISFNNDYLVHLSGLSANNKKHNRIGLTSVIGTTFIGFFILLFGHSVIIKQTALITLGGMFGFIAFLWMYRDVLDKIVIHCFSWKNYFIHKKTIYFLFIGTILLFYFTPAIKFATDISTFKYETPFLKKERLYFENAQNSVNFKNVYAVPVNADPLSMLNSLKEMKHSITGHPLDFFQSKEKQINVIKLLNQKYLSSLLFFEKSLQEKGMNLVFPNNLTLQKIHPMDQNEFLNKVNTFFPIPCFMTVDNQNFLIFNSTENLSEVKPLISMSPKPYYNNLLTSITKQMSGLLAGGLVLMFLFDLLIQKSFSKVSYIYAPLILSATIFKLYLNYSHNTFHIIHMMGWAIVLTLATDYTSVSVSWRHNTIQLNKILLTGLSTFISFGILSFSNSPVLKDLGFTVFLGTISSLLFALFFHLKQQEKELPC